MARCLQLAIFMSIVAFIIFGIVVGFIARALMPGRQSMGIVGTCLLGVGGSFLGGIIGNLLSGRDLFDLHSAGIIGSVIGSLLILLAVGSRRRRALI